MCGSEGRVLSCPHLGGCAAVGCAHRTGISLAAFSSSTTTNASMNLRGTHRMLALLTRINKNLVLAIPVAMVLGFGFGLMVPVGWLKSLIVPLTFLMVYPMMVNLKLQKVLEGGDLKAQALAQAINFAVIPFVAFGLGKVFFADQPWYA